MASIVVAVASFVISAVSAAYQVVQAKKQKEKAEAAAESRRGFEIATEGNASDLSLVYGRAIVGGSRTFHAGGSDFKYVTPNSDKAFLTGTGSRAAYTQTYTRYSGGMIGDLIDLVREQATVAIPTMESGYLNQSVPGTKNEFLYFQQALCVGPINAVYDVVIDGGRYISDPALGTYGYAEDEKRSRMKAAMRIDCHYGSEPRADAIIGANFGERLSAVFDGMAYASCVTRVDRNNPQFNSVPGLQFLIEGRLVRKVIGGVLQSERVYSNNPAWCLLDYLLDEEVGKGVSTDELNLPSFEAAAALYATIVQSDVAVGGKIWQPTDGSRHIATMDMPLYECNIILDPRKPVRENIEAILATAGDSRLVWSGGKYSLSAQYPATNDAIDLAEVLTDDDLVLDQEIEISWPTASERLNQATVRFHNEFEGFREDSVSWPPKITDTYYRGIGGFRYGLPNGSWDEGQPGNRLLNSYGVWDTDASDITLDYLMKIEPEQAGSYTLTYTGDDSMSIVVTEAKTGSGLIYTGSRSTWDHNVSTATVNLGHSSGTKFYHIHIVAHDNGATTEKAMKGVGAKLENSTTVLWSTREPSYSDFVEVNYDSTVYDTMFAEDGNTELETSVFAEGITDPYHALAKAEELVRTSRSAFSIQLKYNVKGRYLEPGDFIRLESETLNLGFGSNPLYIRVNSVKVDEKAVCTVNGSRFDWTQLAWNVKDDIYVTPRSIYDSQIGLISNLTYTPPISIIAPSSGVLSWTAASGFDVAGYAIYTFNPETDAYDGAGHPIFNEIGRASGTSFTVPPISASSLFFGVRTVALGGRMSDMVTISYTDATDLDHNWLKGVRLTVPQPGFYRDKADLTIKPTSITATAETHNFIAPVYKWLIDDVVQTDQTSSTLVIPSFSNKRFKIIEVQVSEDGGTNVYRSFVSLTYTTEGLDSAMLVIDADRQIIIFGEDGNPSPTDQLVTLRAVKQNLSTDAITWTLKRSDGTVLSPTTYLSSATGDTVTMTAANFKTAIGSDVGVIIQASGKARYDTSVVISSNVSVSKASVGLGAISVQLSKSTIPIPADTNGQNEIFTNSGLVITVREGDAILAYNPGTPAAGEWKVTADGGGNVTVGSVTDTGTTATYGPITAMTANAGRIAYSITGKRVNGTAFTATAEASLIKVLGAVIDFTPPGPPSFPGTPLTYEKSTLPDGSVQIKATLTWNTPSTSFVDLAYYDVGIRKNGDPVYVYSQTSGNSYSWIVVPNFYYDYIVNAVDKNTNRGNYVNLTNQQAPADTTVPSAPTPGSSVTSIKTAFLKWTNASDAVITSIQIFESTSPSIPSTPITTVNAIPGQPGAYSRSGILAGQNYYYWLKSVTSSGIVSAASTMIGPLVSSTIASDDFTAGTINANILQSATSLPAGLYMGSTGFSLGNLAGVLTSDPYSGSTLIQPGRILTSGAGRFSDWLTGPNNTEINGDFIATTSVKANKLTIGARNISIEGVQFQAVTSAGVATNTVEWTSGKITYINDAGTAVVQDIAAGSATWSSTTLYLYWIKGSSTISSNTATGSAYGEDRIVLATYAGSSNLIVTYGGTIIHGDQISTGDRILANSVTATQIDSRGLSIKKPDGTVILSAGDALAYSNVTGGPPANATNGATFGLNVGGIFNPTTWIADASIKSAMIEELHATKIVAGTITADKIVGGAIAEMRTSPGQGGPHSISGSAGSTVDSTTLTVISTGGPHLINVYAEIGTTSGSPSGCIIVLLCDGSEVGRAGIWCPGSWGAQGTSFPVVHTPGVGSHTYTVRCTTPGGGGSGPYTVNRSVIAYIEMKKTGV